MITHPYNVTVVSESLPPYVTDNGTLVLRVYVTETKVLPRHVIVDPRTFSRVMSEKETSIESHT